MVAAHDLKSCGVIHAGSTPALGTSPLIAQLVEQLPLKETVGGSIPSERTKCFQIKIAEVAKLADALALGASGVIHGGSNPLLGTNSFSGLDLIFYIVYNGKQIRT